MKYCNYCFKEIKDDVRFCPFCGGDQSASSPPHHLPPGTVIGRKYRVGAALGEGGFGITYVGLDEALNLRVAIKEFFPYGFVTRVGTVSAQVTEMGDAEKAAFFQKGKTRFMEEARVLARFSGARGIVDVRDFFEENNTAYIVMEYVDGVTLKQYLKEHGTLSPDETLRLLTPVMESLRELHKENLIHRDISPDNIMLVGNEVKLLDFGAARSVGGDQKSLSVMLKPGYAPEEQYRSRGRQGPWTDVYALCATMYKCITGVRPEESPDRLDEDLLKKPSTLGIHISPQFEAALMKGLEVKARDRWQSIDELLKGLTSKTPTKKAEPAPKPQKKEEDPNATRVLLSQEGTEESPEKTLPVETPQAEPPKAPAPDLPEPAEKTKKNRGLKVAIGFAAALVVILVIAIAANSRKSADNSFETLTFGTYEQDGNTSNGKEEIEWLVLKKEGNRALVISKYALNCKPYNKQFTDVTWETCSLRTWLNDNFYNAAFSESEKSKIQSTTVTADANPDYDTDPGNDTTDKVFLLSIDEVNEYFSSDEARKCAATKYAEDQGAWTSDDYTTSDGKPTCWWWLRSPGLYSDRAAGVSHGGSVHSIGLSGRDRGGAVRPALWITLES